MLLSLFISTQRTLFMMRYLHYLYWDSQMKYTTYIALHLLLNTLKYLHYFTVQCLHYFHCYSHHLYYEFVFQHTLVCSQNTVNYPMRPYTLSLNDKKTVQPQITELTFAWPSNTSSRKDASCCSVSSSFISEYCFK